MHIARTNMASRYEMSQIAVHTSAMGYQYRLGLYHRNIFDIPASPEPGISSDHSRSVHYGEAA